MVKIRSYLSSTPCMPVSPLQGSRDPNLGTIALVSLGEANGGHPDMGELTGSKIPSPGISLCWWG